MAWDRKIRFALGAAWTALLLMNPVSAVPPLVSANSLNEVFNVPSASSSAPNPRLEDAVLEWLNQMRAGQHLRPLQVNVVLRAIARAYGQEMFVHGYLSHVSRDGRTLQDRLDGSGLRFNVIGENLAYAPDIRAADQALWQSAPHRRNILYPVFQTVGIAVIDGGTEGVVIVEDFSDSPAAVARSMPASSGAGSGTGAADTGAPPAQ